MGIAFGTTVGIDDGKADCAKIRKLFGYNTLTIAVGAAFLPGRQPCGKVRANRWPGTHSERAKKAHGLWIGRDDRHIHPAD